MIKQKGQVLLFVIVVVTVILISTLHLIAGSQLYYQNSVYSNSAETATALAEAGVDKAIASLNRTGGTYSGEQETKFGEGSYSVEITTKDAATKVIEATGYLPNKIEPKVTRKVQIEASTGVGVSFSYGVQVGEGGLQLGNSNRVIGSIYSNGSVVMNNSNEITGDVWVAGGSQATADQQTDCSGVNCQDYLFGKPVGGSSILDVAQSFVPSQTTVLNKISLKIKKFGNPSDFAVRIMGNSGSNPNKNNVLASGMLYSSLVTNSYGWVDVTFNTTPNLTAGITYWIVADTSSNVNNYWSWQNDLAQSYNGGVPKWSPNWNAGNPTWNSISGDLSFQTYMGGVPTSLAGGNSGLISGNVHANTISSVSIAGDAYYQSIDNSPVSGSSCPNSNCHPGTSDPAPQVMPISDANIAQWKAQAELGGVTNGDITNCSANLGPRKIVGNVTFNNSCTVNINAPLWITGNLHLNNSNTLRLPASFGTASGVIVVDGTITMDNSNRLLGSGQGNSILLGLSTYDSRSNGLYAIRINNSGNSGVLYAGVGIIEPGNSNSFKELTAWGIRLANSTTITYETGLASTLFSSGPTGSYSLVEGTYQDK